MFANGPIVLGQYRPIDSFLHHLDARAKMLPVTLVLVLSLLTDSAAFYVIILGALISGLLLSGVGAGTLSRNFRPILLLVVITMAYHLIFYQGPTRVLVTIFGWSIREGAVMNAVFYSLRLVLFISMAFLITLTSSPSELAEALAKLFRPLRKIGIPVNDLALIVFIAIRFVPILFEEFTAIRNAQMIRGVNFSGSFVTRLKKTTYIMLPVFMAAISRADDLALAIEARGYRSNQTRTFYTHGRFGAGEAWFMVLSSTTIVILFYLTR